MERIEVNGKIIEIKNNVIMSNYNLSTIKSNIYRWLSRIGIFTDYINIEHNRYKHEDPFAEISWTINGDEFFYRCNSQSTNNKCLSAIEQLVHQEVIFIERGIKSFGQSMNQFKIGYSESGEKILSSREIIGVDKKNNDLEYIKFLYKKKAIKLHPDYGGNEEEFKKLNSAMQDLEKELGN